MYSLEIEQLTVNYEETSVLWDISLSLPDKKMVAVVGPNGAGKSTFLKTLLGGVKPISGSILLYGQPLEKMRGHVGYVPQRSSVDWDFPITAFDLVMMGCFRQIKWFKWVSKKARHLTEQALEMVKMTPFAQQQIGQLSGGQQQRLFIARALAQQADIYLLDEPFAGVDIVTETALMQLLKELRDAGKTIIIVHHDLSSVEEHFDWVVLLNTCLIAAGPVSEIFNAQNIQRTYGKRHLFLEEAIFQTKKNSTGVL